MNEILSPEVLEISLRLKPNVEKMTTDAKAVAAVITNEESYNQAGTFLKALKEYAEHIDQELGHIRDHHHRTHKAIVALIKERTGPLDRAWDMVSIEMVNYKKKERLAIEAEQKRREAEARKQEEDERLATAQALHESGETELAQELLSQEVHVTVPKMAEAKVDGISFREGKWKARLENKMALVLAVKTHPELLNAIEINMSWLNNQAQKLDGKLKYPGIFTEKEDPGIVVSR